VLPGGAANERVPHIKTIANDSRRASPAGSLTAQAELTSSTGRLGMQPARQGPSSLASSGDVECSNVARQKGHLVSVAL
jgi:hypothetical protein